MVQNVKGWMHMRDTICGQQFDAERALYHLQNTDVVDCVFAGPADGESAFKEARNVGLKNCSFSLRYPLWHTEGFALDGCTMDERPVPPSGTPKTAASQTATWGASRLCGSAAM